MTKKIVIANWKLNPVGDKEAKALFLKTRSLAKELKKTEVVICPPFLYLGAFYKLKTPKNMQLGSQNSFWEEKGAFTGEVSAGMLKSHDVKFSIVGHSERRAMGETDKEISLKINALLKQEIIPVLCVGEKERDMHGEYLSFIKNELFDSLAGVQKKQLKNIIIAYEPIWAIGKSQRDAMSPGGVHETVLLIRKFLTEKYGADSAKLPRIIYGGSAEGENAEKLMNEGHVSGFLVGHASLDPMNFGQILKAVEASQAAHA